MSTRAERYKEMVRKANSVLEDKPNLKSEKGHVICYVNHYGDLTVDAHTVTPEIAIKIMKFISDFYLEGTSDGCPV